MAKGKAPSTAEKQMVKMAKGKAPSTAEKQMVLKPSDLARLEGIKLIIFDVDEENRFEKYKTVLSKMACACTGVETGIPNNIRGIPVTIRMDDVYVIEMRGEFEGFVFNKERLMGICNSNYFAAVQYEEDWYEVNKSKRPIEGAHSLQIDGSYTEYSGSGLRNNKMKFGFRALMYGLIGLLKKIKTKPVSEFLCVCVNLFEPVRYPVMGRKLIQLKLQTIDLPTYFIYLIYIWKTLSKEVIDCKEGKKKKFKLAIKVMNVQIYGDEGTLVYKEFSHITNDDVHLLLGMAKCNVE